MKRILLGILAITAVAGVAFQNTRAAWTDSVTVTNNIVSTGTLDLEVSVDGTSWTDASSTSTTTLAGLFPGGAPVESSPAFYLRNVSSPTSLSMNLTAQVVPSASITPTSGVDRSMLYIQLYSADGDETVATTLSAWEGGAVSLSNALAYGLSGKAYGIRAWLDGAALNEWQGQTVNYTLSFTGSQP